MKKICIILVLILVLFVSSCGPNSKKDNKDDVKYIEKLTDPLFEQGIQITGLQSRNVSYTYWQYQNKAKGIQPIWELGQYCDLSTTRPGYDSTVNDLSLGTLFEDGYGIESNDGTKEKLTNKSGSKEIIVDTQSHVVSLNIDTSKEYLDNNGKIKPLSAGEDWVHMILQQSAGGVVIDDYDEIYVELNFKLTRNDIIDASFGTSQFQWIFSIKDKDSVINDYFWFNLTIFDARYEKFPGHHLEDSGKADATGKFIYAPETSKYLDEPLEIGKEYNVRINIKPFIVEAFKLAQDSGFLDQSKFSSMVLNSLNIGWEVTNVSVVGVDISHVGLKVKEK